MLKSKVDSQRLQSKGSNYIRDKRPKEFMHDKGHAGFRVFKIDPVSFSPTEIMLSPRSIKK